MTDTPSDLGGLHIPGLPTAEAQAASMVEAGGVSQAWREAEQFSAGKSADELAAEAAEAEHGRNQRFKNQFELLAVTALWLSAVTIAVIAGVWVWHMVAPARLRWLSTEDISHLQSIATAGLLVGVVGNHFKKRLG